MEKEIEKAIRETLVISNPQSINIAVKKILLLFSVSSSLDLDSLEKKLDEALAKETPKSLNKWLKRKRQ